MISVKLQTGRLGGRGLGSLIDTNLPKKAAMKFGQRAGTMMRRVIHGEVMGRSKNPTGKLANSFRVRASQTGGLVSLDTRSSLPYARIQDRGGHIRARRFPFLHFKTSNGWVKVKTVRIPAKRYLAAASRRARPVLSRMLREAIREEQKARR